MAEKKLYVCLDKNSRQIFFASMISERGAQAEMRSSGNFEKGMMLLMRPVPENWGGDTFTPEMITESQETMEAHINRTEGRGTFSVRILSTDQKELIERVRTRAQMVDTLKIETTEAGMVVTMRLEGRITLETAAKLQSVLRGLSVNQTLLLLDLTQDIHLATTGVGMFFMMLKEAVKHGRFISILVEPESRIGSVLGETKIGRVAKIYTKRDEAVAALLKKTLE